MKKFARNLILAGAILSVSGCGLFGKGPGDVAVEMFERVCKAKDLSIMLEYAAPESVSLLQMGISFAKDDPNSLSNCNEDITLVSEEIEGDRATVVTNNEDKPTKWRKIDGEWKYVLVKD